MTAIEEKQTSHAAAVNPRIHLAPFLIIVLSAVLNSYLAFKFPLAPDETYYWEWSRRPGWGYFDQGPMIAWWIRAGCWLFGDTQFGIRSGIIVAFALAQIFLFLLFRDLIGQRLAQYALLLVSITPIALVGGFVATYDPLQVLFWSAAMYFASRALLFESKTAWLGVGAAFGFGMLSKHTMALFLVCLAAVILSHKEYRAKIANPWPYFGAAIALLIFAPSIRWQNEHGWMTYQHLITLSGKGTDQPFLRRLLDFVGSQAGVLTPLLFIGFVAALYSILFSRKLSDKRLSYLFWMSVPVIAFFLLMTVKSKVQANWAVCGWLTPPSLFTVWALGKDDTNAATRRYFAVAVGLCATLSALLCVPEGRSSLGIQIPPSWDSQVNKMYGGEDLARAVEMQTLEMGKQGTSPPIIGSATYDIAARLAFYVKGHPRTRCFFLDTRENSYLLWNDEAALRPGESAIVVDDFELNDPRRPRFEEIFQRIEPAPSGVNVFRHPVYKEPLHTYFIYRCYGYRPNPAVERARRG